MWQNHFKKLSKFQKFLLKEIQTFKAYQTESCKYCMIIAGNNTKISKTHRLLSKMLFSVSAFLFAYCDLHFLCLLQQQSFISSWTQYSANFHKWSSVPCIVLFSSLKMAFSKLTLAKYHCLHKKNMFTVTSIYFIWCLQLLQSSFTNLFLF